MVQLHLHFLEGGRLLPGARHPPKLDGILPTVDRPVGIEEAIVLLVQRRLAFAAGINQVVVDGAVLRCKRIDNLVGPGALILLRCDLGKIQDGDAVFIPGDGVIRPAPLEGVPVDLQLRRLHCGAGFGAVVPKDSLPHPYLLIDSAFLNLEELLHRTLRLDRGGNGSHVPARFQGLGEDDIQLVKVFLPQQLCGVLGKIQHLGQAGGIHPQLAREVYFPVQLLLIPLPILQPVDGNGKALLRGDPLFPPSVEAQVQHRVILGQEGFRLVGHGVGGCAVWADSEGKAKVLLELSLAPLGPQPCLDSDGILGIIAQAIAPGFAFLVPAPEGDEGHSIPHVMEPALQLRLDDKVIVQLFRRNGKGHFNRGILRDLHRAIGGESLCHGQGLICGIFPAPCGSQGQSQA